MKKLLYLLLGSLILFYSCKKSEDEDFSDIPTTTTLYCGYYQIFKAVLDSGSSYSSGHQTEIFRVKGNRRVELRGFIHSDVNLMATYKGNVINIYKQTVPVLINDNGDADSITVSGQGTYTSPSCEFRLEFEISYTGLLSSIGGVGRYYLRADGCEDYNYSYESANQSATISSTDYTITNVKYDAPPNLFPNESIDYDAITTTREDCFLRINNQRVYNNVTGVLDSIIGTVISYEDVIKISIENKDLESSYFPFISSITIQIPK